MTDEDVCAQYGMVAVADLKDGETVFEIPRSLLLTPMNSSIAVLLQEGNCFLKFSYSGVDTQGKDTSMKSKLFFLIP